MKKLFLFLILFIVGCGGGGNTETPDPEPPVEPPKENVLDASYFEYELYPASTSQYYSGIGAKAQDAIYFTPKNLSSSAYTVIAEATINPDTLYFKLFDLHDRIVIARITIDIETLTGEDEHGNDYSLYLEKKEGLSGYSNMLSGKDRFGCSGDDCVSQPTNCDYDLSAQESRTDLDTYNCDNSDLNGSYQGASWSDENFYYAVTTNGSNAIAVKGEL